METVIGDVRSGMKVMTGSYDLNQWLDGGYEHEVITLFYGPAASGKSNVAMLAACHNAKKDKKIIYIDSEGGFSVDRVSQIAGNIPEFVLKNIVLLKPTTFEEQNKVFAQMAKAVKNHTIGLIIVDSMTMLYRLALADARAKGMTAVHRVNADLVSQMKYLHTLARRQAIPAVITSQVYNEFLSEEDWLAGKEAEVGMVGGDILRYWSKCIVELQNKGGKRKAILRKHRSLPEKELNFEIVNEGVQKRGWF